MDPILKVTDLSKDFVIKQGLTGKRVLKAVDNISFYINTGETFAIVGESGSGKTTTGRLVLRLLAPTKGFVEFNGKNIFSLNQRQLNSLRREMQIVFQDPYSSMNPWLTVFKIIEEPLIVHGVRGARERKKKVEQFIEYVGLSPAYHSNVYPDELSGGQRQRVAIARALILNPKLIICDEPVSALDVSIQSQIINLLHDLQKELNLTYIFISHDMGVVHHISDRIAVMYAGQIVEITSKHALFEEPLHPYTKALFSSILNFHTIINQPDDRRKQRNIIQGELQDLFDSRVGCRFYHRCNCRNEYCQNNTPTLREVKEGHYVACVLS